MPGANQNSITPISTIPSKYYDLFVCFLFDQGIIVRNGQTNMRTTHIHLANYIWQHHKPFTSSIYDTRPSLLDPGPMGSQVGNRHCW